MPTEMILKLSVTQMLALDRVLDAIVQEIKEGKSFVRIPLNNAHFSSLVVEIAKMRAITVTPELEALLKNERDERDAR